MVEAVEQKGLPDAYVLFEGEQHGFRKAESTRSALEAELSFYAHRSWGSSATTCRSSRSRTCEGRGEPACGRLPAPERGRNLRGDASVSARGERGVSCG